jgi:CheY-like chemotaxis protein
MDSARHDQIKRGLRLLVVEDEPDAAGTLAILLRSEGYEVRIATDAGSALSAAEAEPADVVLLDIGLPGTDGYEVARQLRELETKPDPDRKTRPVIIAVSGYDRDDQRLRSYGSGMDLHLVKPVEADELLRILDRIQGLTQ